jgi:hypothetical protein
LSVGDDRVFDVLECGQDRLSIGEQGLLCPPNSRRSQAGRGVLAQC